MPGAVAMRLRPACIGVVRAGCCSANVSRLEYHQCMTPRVRSTRGVISPSLGPEPYALDFLFVIQPVLPDLVQESTVRKIEQSRGSRAIAVGASQGALDERPLERLRLALHREVEIRGRRRRR